MLRGHTVHAFSTASRPYAFTVCLAGEVGLQLAAHTAEARGRWGHVITQASEQAAQVRMGGTERGVRENTIGIGLDTA